MRRIPSPTLIPLKRRAEYLRVARGRRKTAQPGLVLQARDRAPAGHDGAATDAGAGFRVGFTASRKVGGAVVRNRARRRLRAAAKDVMPELAAGGTDYVIIARAGTVSRPYGLLLEDLRRAMARLAPRATAAGRAG